MPKRPAAAPEQGDSQTVERRKKKEALGFSREIEGEIEKKSLRNFSVILQACVVSEWVSLLVGNCSFVGWSVGWLDNGRDDVGG